MTKAEEYYRLVNDLTPEGCPELGQDDSRIIELMDDFKNQELNEVIKSNLDNIEDLDKTFRESLINEWDNGYQRGGEDMKANYDVNS